jgi:MFS family permease
MKETVKNKQKFSRSILRIKKDEIIEWRVMPSAIVTMLYYISYGALLTLVPDWSAHLGIANKGLFFMTFTISSILFRFIAGKTSDRYGRVVVIKASLIAVSISMVLLGLSNSVFSLLLASAIYGVGTGIFSPANNAWTVDLSHPEHRGKAVSTMYIALEVGIGGGALVAGWLFNDVISRVPMLFFLSGGTALIALIYMFFLPKPIKSYNG